MKRFVVAMLGIALMGLGASAATGPARAASSKPAAQPAGARTPAMPADAPIPRPATAVPVAVHVASALAPQAQNELVDAYCANCHNDDRRSGGLSLEHFDAATIVGHAEVAEKMIRKLRAGMMPPANAKRPEPATVQALVTALETRIDRAAALDPNPGSRPFQRLNRVEYASAVKALVGLDVDVAAYLPPDTISHSFDNIADSQAFSPTLMDGYLRAASQISRLAIGDRHASPGSATYKISREASQMRHVDGAPMGTRGGVSTVHTFPADGDYVFKLAMHYEPLGGLMGRTTMTAQNLTEEIEVSIDGERVALLPLSTRMSETDPNHPLEVKTPPIHVSAGPQRVSAAFIQRFDGPNDDLMVPLENTLADVSITFGVTLLPHVRDLTILGPSRVTGVSDTRSRRRIFTCRPTAASEEAACAAEIVKRLASQAYREPVGGSDFEDLMGFFHQGRKKGDFETGVRMALQAILASPKFLFRMEQAPAAGYLKASAVYRVSDIDLASRLSFFLWGTGPDAALVKTAMRGGLAPPAGFQTQVRRMLADRRAEALSTRFASQWLRLQDLEKIHPDYLYYPQYDGTLAEAMLTETRLFFDSIVREDRSVLDLLTADYSFVNERLAIHYGIPNVTGPEFRRVALPESRRGLLGHGSILTLTSVADRTSPVLRGKWIMEVLLGTPPPPPPPNVPALDDSVKAAVGGKRLSTRERMEEHRKNPACNSCHRVIDPLGLALDHFDVTGAYRIKDNEVPVDVAGVLYDGSRIDGAAGLRAALLKHQDVVLQNFAESLMTYALGRRVEYYDMPAIRRIVRDASTHGYRMSSFILGVATSPAFRMAKAEPVRPVATDAASARPEPRSR